MKLMTLVILACAFLPNLSLAHSVPDQEARAIIEAGHGRSINVLMVGCFVGKSPGDCRELRARGACKYDVLRPLTMMVPSLDMNSVQKEAYMQIRKAGKNISDIFSHQTNQIVDNYEHVQNFGSTHTGRPNDDGRLCDMTKWPNHVIAN